MRWLASLTALAAVLAITPARAAEEKVKMDDKTKKAVEKALAWLKDQQNRDGSWGNTAVTSFALLVVLHTVMTNWSNVTNGPRTLFGVPKDHYRTPRRELPVSPVLDELIA